MGKHYDRLCAEERGAIMAMTQAEQGVREIARVLNRTPSSISRERRRNGWHSDSERGAMGRPTIAGGYDAKRAGQRAPKGGTASRTDGLASTESRRAPASNTRQGAS